MEGRKLALFLSLVVYLLLPSLLNAEAKPWWRRRRKCLKVRGVRWHNALQGRIDFKCSRGKSIGVWTSFHDNCKEDRIHHFRCKRGPFYYRNRHCYTTNYVNRFDGKVEFTCPYRGVIVGVKSRYSTYHKDRRFSFRCCSKKFHRATSCRLTRWQNYWDGRLRFFVPGNYYLVGVQSVHRNYYEDRRYKFHICKFKRRRGRWLNETGLSYDQGLKRHRMPSKVLVKE